MSHVRTASEVRERSDLEDVLPICGCGEAQAAADFVLAVLELHPLHEDENWRALEELLPNVGTRFFVLGVLDDLGFTEHGGIISGAWLTPKGEWMRDGLRRYPDLLDVSA